MNRTMNFVYGAGIGAALMYLADPQMGRRRRAAARDKMGSMVRNPQDVIARTLRAAGGRARGIAAQAEPAAGFVAAALAEDEKLMQKIRSKIEHVVSHPRAVRVEAMEGRVILTGHVLASEAQSLLRRVSSLRGVHEVEDRLQMHDVLDESPELWGAGSDEAVTGGWSATTRFLVAATTAIVAAYFLVRRRPLLAAAEVAGTGLLLRAKSPSVARNHFEPAGAGR